MKSLLLMVCVCIAAAAFGSEPAKQIITTRSFTGQFTAREIRNKPSPWAIAPNAMSIPSQAGMTFLVQAPPGVAQSDPEKIQLEAETVGITCERIKELFLRAFGLKDEWRGKIEILINSFLPEGREPVLTGTYRPDGWSYRLELPRTMREEALVRAIVQSLFQELINRKAGSQSTEVPYWLVAGYTAYLRAFSPPTYIVRGNVQTPGALDVRVKGLADVHAGLFGQTPLTFQQLSWPRPADVNGPGETVYRSCAMLLFNDLLRLADGPACFQKFFDDMPKHLNWQTAFLEAFHPHFSRLLDVEKWWALSCVAFKDSDMTDARAEKECWQKLQDALDVPVEVRLSATNMPAEARLTLQEVIMQWKPAEAAAALQRAVRNLEGLQMYAFRYELDSDVSTPPGALKTGVRNAEDAQTRIGREVSPLVVRYLTAIVNYQKRLAAGGSYSSHMLIKKDAVRELNALDKEREALRTKLLSPSRTAGAPVPGSGR